MRLRWLFAAILLFAVLLGFFARHWLAESHRASAQLAAWEQEEQLEAALDKPIEIRLGKPVPLQTWLDEFTKQSGVQVVPYDLGKLPANLQVHLDVSLQPASSALDALAQETILHWSVERDGSVSLYASASFPTQYLRTYPLRPAFSPHLQEQIAQAAQSLIEPDSWEQVGGQGALVEAPDHFVVVQRSDVHGRLREFLDALQVELKQAADVPWGDLSPHDLRLQPRFLSAHSKRHAQILSKLERKVSINVVDRPLAEVVAQVAAAIEVRIDSSQYEDEFSLAHHVTLQADLRAKTILRMILAPGGAQAIAGNGEDVLRLVTSDESHSPVNMVTVTYAVPDFARHNDETRRLVDVITWAVEPDSWEDVGGPGACQVLDNVLLVTQADYNLPRIEALLTALRMVRSGQKSWASAELPSPDRDKTLRILDQPLALKYDKRPLKEVVQDIAERTGLFIYFLKEIEDAGATPDTPVTCDLPSRPLQQNLRSLLSPLYLTFLVQGETLAITSQEDALSPDHIEIEVLDARPLLAGHCGTPNELHKLLVAAVEPDSWEDVGGPGFIEEFQGLLVVGQRPELLSQVRHVYDAVERQSLAPTKARDRGNLITRKPADGHPNDPIIHLSAVDDLLTPQGPLTQLQLLQAIQSVTLPNGAQESNSLQVEIHFGHFVTAYLHPSQVKPFEDNLRKLRNMQR